MTLVAIKGELSALQAGKKKLIDKSIISKNGIVYTDPKPLIYCDIFRFIPSPAFEKCRSCYAAREVLELTEETREMYLDKNGDVNEVNRGKDEPVNACLLLASVINEGETENKIVYRVFDGAKRCPMEL